jgi:hypothetical protein
MCSTRAGGYGAHDIWMARKEGGTWQPAENLGGTVNTYSNEQPCWVSADGRILVFTSDRAGGYGGMDLYYTTRSGNDWTAPENLGSVLNSSGNDYSASFHCNRNVIGGIIYIGSSRAGGQGGFDLWTSEEDEFHVVDATSLGGAKAAFR